jgi:hypothetical protein
LISALARTIIISEVSATMIFNIHSFLADTIYVRNKVIPKGFLWDKVKFSVGGNYCTKVWEQQENKVYYLLYEVSQEIKTLPFS